MQLTTMVRERRMGFGRALLSLASSVCIAGLISCSGVDDAPGTQVESPAERRRSPAPAPSSSASAVETPKPQAPGTAFTSIDAAIAEDWPPKQWSKNVPNRACVRDDECGDGFCDRGQCAAIWTWTETYGQKCGTLPVYHPYLCNGPRPNASREPACDYIARLNCLCVDGRCRSCASDDECVKQIGDPRAVCLPRRDWPTRRACVRPSFPYGSDPSPK